MKANTWRLRNARKRKGFTQSKLAEKLGYTQAMVSAIERGQALPSLDKAFRYALVLGESVDWFWGDEVREAHPYILRAGFMESTSDMTPARILRFRSGGGRR